MQLPDWAAMFPEEDRRVYEASGYGQRQDFGERPALIVIDCTYDFAGDRPEPILESIKRFPMSSGERAWEAIGHIQRLLAKMREKGYPVFYTKGESTPSQLDLGGWRRKHARAVGGASPEGSLGSQIVKEIAPEPHEIVISKKRPSAFFCTPLVTYLLELKVDTVLLTGGTTSGCVRASAVDSFSYGFTTFVVEEGCFDRAVMPHRANLFDIQMKYGDVIGVDAALRYLDGLGD